LLFNAEPFNIAVADYFVVCCGRIINGNWCFDIISAVVTNSFHQRVVLVKVLVSKLPKLRNKFCGSSFE